MVQYGAFDLSLSVFKTIYFLIDKKEAGSSKKQSSHVVYVPSYNNFNNPTPNCKLLGFCWIMFYNCV